MPYTRDLTPVNRGPNSRSGLARIYILTCQILSFECCILNSKLTIRNSKLEGQSTSVKSRTGAALLFSQALPIPIVLNRSSALHKSTPANRMLRQTPKMKRKLSASLSKRRGNTSKKCVEIQVANVLNRTAAIII